MDPRGSTGSSATGACVCGRRRVTRLMRLAGLEGRCKKRWRKTTVADPEAEAAKDLIQRHFGPGAEIDRRYVGDITYIATWEGWAYLATVIDLASRKVVGWSLADHMRTELVEDALTMAFANRAPEEGVIFHSDRGCQYTSQGLRRSRSPERRRALGRAEGRVLGQRGGRILLRHHQARAHRHPGLADEGRTSPCRLRVHRGLVQHPPAALDARLPQPEPVRSSTTTPTVRRHNQLKQPVRRTGSSPSSPTKGLTPTGSRHQVESPRMLPFQFSENAPTPLVMKISQMVLQQAVGAGIETSKGLAKPSSEGWRIGRVSGSGPISVGFGPGPKEGWTSGVVVDGFIDRRSRAKPPRWVSIRTRSESARRVRWQVPRSPNVA